MKISYDVIACDLRFGPPNAKSWLRLCMKLRAMCIPDTCRCIFVLLYAPLRVVANNIAKVQNICCIASSLKILSYGIWKKILVWNGRFLVWYGNGVKENCRN